MVTNVYFYKDFYLYNDSYFYKNTSLDLGLYNNYLNCFPRRKVKLSCIWNKNPNYNSGCFKASVTALLRFFIEPKDSILPGHDCWKPVGDSNLTQYSKKWCLFSKLSYWMPNVCECFVQQNFENHIYEHSLQNCILGHSHYFLPLSAMK